MVMFFFKKEEGKKRPQELRFRSYPSIHLEIVPKKPEISPKNSVNFWDSIKLYKLIKPCSW
jgi:hypothetical protein